MAVDGMDTDDSMLEQVLGLCESFAAMARSLVEASPPTGEGEAGKTEAPVSAQIREPFGRARGLAV